MKRESLGWFVAGVLTVLSCTLGAMQQQQDAVGRWQLTVLRDETREKDFALLRFDTATGETRVWDPVTPRDRALPAWIRIPETR